MVLVLAALYSIYQSQRGEKDKKDFLPHPAYLKQQVSEGLDNVLVNFQTTVRCSSTVGEEAEETEFFLSSDTAEDSGSDSVVAMPRSQQSPEGPLTQVSPPVTEVFSEAVRAEWINAIFGADFCKAPVRSSSPRQGLGLAAIAPYTSYSVRIPADCQGDKLGITVSRLPLGVYVRKVKPHSEAAFLGVEEGSVLVEINGIALLAEPTKQALERLWQYEGFLETEMYIPMDEFPDLTNSSPHGSPTNEMEESTKHTVRDPVSMTFIRKGRLYTVVFLSCPHWGISWAPCGNFPLVKRVFSFAATAGVQKGSLVAGVQDRSFRELDHVGTAEVLKDTFQSRSEINLILACPPSAARSGHHDRLAGYDTARPPEKLPEPRRTIRTIDGVEVKFHSLEASLGGLCRPNSLADVAEDRQSLADFAEMVAGGVAESPSSKESTLLWSNSKIYSPCPKLTNEQLLDKWDPLEALLYCLRFHHVGYREEEFMEMVVSTDHQSRNPVQLISELMTARPHHSPSTAGAYLLQIISVICSPSHYHETEEEKKTDEMVSVEAKRDAKELTSVLLKISRRDEGFCQRLYFLLRSYISSLETRRPNNSKGDGPRNLLALLNCLELLRYAEKQLAGQIVEFRRPPEDHPVRTSLESIDHATQQSHSSNGVPAPPVSPEAVPKKKGVLGFLRKKSSTNKTNRNNQTTSNVMSSSLPIRDKKGKRPPRQSPVPPEQHNDASSVDRSLDDLVSQSPSVMYENMSDFLSQLDRICGTIERSLQRSFRQKIADWAMQPWSASKDTALANVTATMRQNLGEAASESAGRLLVNPVESSELLASVDTDECYILPSAHFPILLTFNVSERRSADCVGGEERIYRTTVEILALQGSERLKTTSYMVHAGVAGTIASSDSSRCIDTNGTKQSWFSGQQLVFDTRSSWGAPQTLSLRLSPALGADEAQEEPRFGWVDLSKLWKEYDRTSSPCSTSATTKMIRIESHGNSFDEQGELPEQEGGSVELQLKIETECVAFGDSEKGGFARKRMLLYKHDDDLRQEAFAVHFIRACDNILRAAGLEMKILTFQCIPVGTKRGFVEWVPGSVPLSEICQPFLDSFLETQQNADEGRSSPSMLAKAGLSKYESLTRLGHNHDALRRFTVAQSGTRTTTMQNPVQEYLRSVAYDQNAPYLIRREVMDTYVKSCAGYCVITYILGVGDRHLDNLLLHQSGAFFHCDFSFILGSDPKKFQPMRITEDMVRGMGGRESDNYAKFLSLASAAFLALRRPEIVHVLLSLVRLMEASSLPDLTENQDINDAITGMRDRLKLELSVDQAVAFMEQLIESSLNSRMWLAVDAIHSLGKKF